MPERGEAGAFSNPLPPSRQESLEDDDSHPLTNEDFRKLMMTPRAPSSSKPSSSSAAAAEAMPPPAATKITKPAMKMEEDDDDPATRRRKKKSYYAKLKKMEEDRQKELAAKYRDRAGERREGTNTDYEQTEIISTTADYRAVAPDAKADAHYAERRKQLIQESKYLGGDMEHTHLVKGLDYALLEKVRAEITSKETEEEQMEEVVTKKEDVKEEPDLEEKMNFKTKMGRSIFRTVFKTHIPERNDLFIPGRMAYVVNLEDEYDASDIPTTLIRSKADCPSLESTTTLTTNDIVINKLTQILSYLRQGRRDRKMKKKEKAKQLKEEGKKGAVDEGIYGDIGDYLPQYKERSKDKDRKEKERERDRERGDRDDRRGDRKDRDRDRGRHDRDERHYERERERGRDRGRDKKRNYFEKPADEDEDRDMKDRPTDAKELVKSINEKFSKGWAPADLEREADLMGEAGAQEAKKPGKEDERMKKLKLKTDIDSYAECYPGMMESADAIDDSDDEVDYTKMDQGNKKGPVGRWDFDTQEEYSDYMSNKEALPKAAFQYGVKMADGRKTRRAGPKDEKQQLDREWQKIQNIIQKRKQMGEDGGSNAKSAKY